MLLFREINLACLYMIIVNPFRPAPRSKSVKNSSFIYSFSPGHGYCRNPIGNFKELVFSEIWTCCQKATPGLKGTIDEKTHYSSVCYNPITYSLFWSE